jgi:hypothetical protein
MFWGIWGAGFGGFGAVFLKAVDVGGDTLRVYMAILTVLMGGALGLVGSRAMDRLADDRKVRRKILTARSQITRFRHHVNGLQSDIEKAKAEKERSGSLGLTGAQLVVRSVRICGVAATIPDLDEVLNDDEDLLQASRLFDAWSNIADMFLLLGGAEALREIGGFEKNAAVIINFDLEHLIARINEADKHFARKFSI